MDITDAELWYVFIRSLLALLAYSTIRKEGDRLIVEPVKRPSLLALLATLEPLDEDFPEIEDPPATHDVDL